MKKYAVLIFMLISVLLSGCVPESTSSVIPDPIIGTPAAAGYLAPEVSPTDSHDSMIKTTQMPSDTMAQSSTPENPAPITTAPPVPALVQSTAPTPQRAEKIVEVIKEVPVELPPKIVEVIKEVPVQAPLSEYDFAEREQELRKELNDKYYSFFGMTIVGGHYGYNFYTDTECLIGYSFESKELGKTFYSPKLLPLFLSMDSPSMTVLLNELTALAKEETT